jgi:hypothetical protein
MTHRLLHAAISCAALAASSPAFCQMSSAEQRYNQTVAYCNSGNLARPERDACIRDAGIAFDRARGGAPAPDIDTTSPGGRATVVIPEGAPPPRSDSSTITSPDGDSTIVLPADGSRPISQ